MNSELQSLACYCLLMLSAFFSTSCSEPSGSGVPELPDQNIFIAEAPSLIEMSDDLGLGDYQHDNGARGEMYFPELMGSGGGFIDYNGDGWLDILLVGGGLITNDSKDKVEALRLYMNIGDGSFVEVNEQSGFSGLSAFGQGISAADYDNDGDEDIYFTTLHKNYLFRNDGGVFTNVAQNAGVEGREVWSSSSMFFDADLDGDLDLYVSNYVDWSPEKDIYCSIQGIVIVDTRGAKNLEEQYGQKVYCAPMEFEGVGDVFYRNNGDGSFTDETENAGFLPTSGKALGVAELDYNGDTWPDIYVANDGEPDLLYKNRGDGTFEEIGVSSGVAFDESGRARAGMGIDTGVVDESGRETIFVGNFSSEQIGVYQYQGNDLFKIRGSESKIGQPSFLTLSFGLVLLDIEYDGDLDLLAANGHVWAIRPTLDGSSYRQRAQLFVNQGNGVFDLSEVKSGGVLDKELVARGASYGDYDRDGDIDVLVTENGGPVHLWRNELGESNYLRVHLEGTSSNKEGLGSQIIAVVDGQTMYRRIRTGSSYLSQSEKVASFGLGGSTKVDSLIVNWPSGQRDVFLGVEGRQDILVTEGSASFEEL